MTIRHPRLSHAIMALRPGARPGIDFVCQDNADGQGPYLVDGSMQNPPTQAEVDAVTTLQLDDAQFNKSFRVDVIMVRVLFDHENRIRALESKPAITMQQFITAVKNASK